MPSSLRFEAGSVLGSQELPLRAAFMPLSVGIACVRALLVTIRRTRDQTDFPNGADYSPIVCKQGEHQKRYCRADDCADDESKKEHGGVLDQAANRCL
jgi:hypothetical protein